MKQTKQLTAIISLEGDGYVSLCPELDVASQGDTAFEARSNLIEALELFFETADASEVERRLNNEVFVERVEVKVG
ncbi:MAG: type II toxin-antitoxin system HicB family antitoxin [Cyanobacteriota bacterium]|nr:type II toxin-antitoxin system HicB family antitoxin [Cyanobacteriota bacterium]